MSIYIGTTKVTKFQSGTAPLFFATNSDNKLIYPNAAFIDYTGSSGAGSYSESGECTQWALNSARNLVDTEGGSVDIYMSIYDDFKALGRTGSGFTAGVVRYRTDIQNAINATATIAIGWAVHDGSVFQYQNGQNVSINNSWQTFDITMNVVLYAGQIYAPVLKVGSTSILERHACCTFLAA